METHADEDFLVDKNNRMDWHETTAVLLNNVVWLMERDRCDDQLQEKKLVPVEQRAYNGKHFFFNDISS